MVNYKSVGLIILGCGLGLIWATILWLTLISLGTASFILYGNRFIIPILATICCTVPAIFALLSSSYWIPISEKAMVWFVDDILMIIGDEKDE